MFQDNSRFLREIQAKRITFVYIYIYIYIYIYGLSQGVLLALGKRSIL